MQSATDPCYQLLKSKFEFLFEEELLQEFCKMGQIKTFDPGQTIMDIGMAITHMPLVISGCIKIFTEDEEGNELLLYYLENGDTCAVTLNCCTTRSKSSIIAITEDATQLLFIDIGKMEEWMIKYKSWRAFVLESYNSRLNEMVGALDNIVFNSLEERLIKYLRDKAWVTKNSTLSITHDVIASELHASRVGISRLMKKLEKDGIIKQSRKTVEYLEFSK